jgi:molybdopterin converting factor small subunit
MREEDIPKGSQSSENSPSATAMVRIMGNLGQMPHGERIDSDTVSTPTKLGSLLTKLQEKYHLDLRRDSTLIIINGVEARALEDLETVIVSGDDVVLVPMFHGG